MFGKHKSLKLRQSLHTSFNALHDSRLTKAKEVPIDSIYPGILKRQGKILMGKCPFHEEDTASFAVYPNSNTFCCYGCNKTGDVITLYQHLFNCDFKTALDELSNL